MKTVGKNGKVRISTDFDPDLANALEAFCEREGLPESVLLRRAVMHEISVDAHGKPVTS